MKGLTALALIGVLTTGSGISQQTKYPKTVVINEDFDFTDLYGDTVVLYLPSQIIEVGRRRLSASGIERDLYAYKLLYSHCDSLRMTKDSSANSFVTTIGHLESMNKNLNERLKTSAEINIELSGIISLERKKGRKQKFIYGFSGGGVGLLAGLIICVLR